MRAWLAALMSCACTFVLSACAAPGGVAASAEARERFVEIGGASIYVREVGTGPVMMVLHGGPDFDHGYLLPDLDRLADGYRLVYYDQRGRGRSTRGVAADDVSLASDVDDIERLRIALGLQAPLVLGHSWGATLALEYALRHPGRASRLVLMNPAPVSAADLARVREIYVARLGDDLGRQRALREGEAYRAADPETVATRYRLHFRPAVSEAGDYERLMATMRGGFLRQGSGGILLARAVEDRLMADSWNHEDYDLSPRLRSLRVPTLVIAGREDFMASAAERIVASVPGARGLVLDGCGHFAYLECAEQTRAALDAFAGK